MARKLRELVPDQLAYSPAQCAQVMGISLSLLYDLWRRDDGPDYFHEGERRIIPRVSVEKYLAKKMASKK